MIIKASELKVGQSFKLNGQRKWRYLMNAFECERAMGVPLQHVGKLALICDCKTMIVSKEQEVILKE